MKVVLLGWAGLPYLFETIIAGIGSAYNFFFILERKNSFPSKMNAPTQINDTPSYAPNKINAPLIQCPSKLMPQPKSPTQIIHKFKLITSDNNKKIK